MSSSGIEILDRYWSGLHNSGMNTVTQAMRESVKKYEPNKKHKGLTTAQRLMIVDPVLRRKVQEIEKFWMDKANEILTEIMDKIQERIQEPGITLESLVKALDVISTKYNLHLGKPTNIDLDYRVSHSLSDADLNQRIQELQSQFLSPPSLEPPGVTHQGDSLDE